jgi:hypothetical protein
MITIETPVSSSKVVDGQRIHFLPTHFGGYMLAFENLVYDYARQLCPGYTGGLWDFFELDNGGVYMAPASARDLAISVEGNGFQGTLSADAAGIVLTLFALGELANRAMSAKFSFLYHQLREFAAQHAEGPLIFEAID